MTAVVDKTPTIRPFAPTDADYQAIAAIDALVLPEYPETPAELRWNDEQRDPKIRWQRFVGQENGIVVGYAGFSQSSGAFHPRKFNVSVSVRPDRQGRGVGSTLYDHVLLALAPFDPISLRSDAREDQVRGRRFLAARGFVEEMREQESRLDLSGFVPARFDGDVARAEANGIALRTCAQLAGEPDRDQKLYELDWEIHQDVPHTDALTRIPFDVWRRRFDSPNFLLDGNLIAVDTATGAYVGLSVVWAGQASADLYTGLTGVVRSHRKKGIATALKARALAYAKARGGRAVFTWNEQNNTGMLGINFRLGFEKQPAWLFFVKNYL